MLSVCLIFLYILLSAYLVGFSVLKCIAYFYSEKNQEAVWRADSYVMAGLVALTVYAQFFSLFYKVGMSANLLLVAFCLFVIVIFRKKLQQESMEHFVKMPAGKKIFYLFLFLFFAYGASRGVIHYDTGLYHAQSIRWIEEYGTVYGLGNLHCRLAYNSSSFSLSALFSFAFLGGQSFHCAAGFFALVLAKVCSEISEAWQRKKLLLSDCVRIMGIYYLLIIYDEMVSPASDYFTVITVFYIIIRWLDLLEGEEKSPFPYGLLCLAGVYTMSLKLSAALILLLVIKPAAMLLKQKKVKDIFLFLCMGIIIIAPCLCRNVVLSGWLVYPFSVLDLFSVDWKIPKGIADYDAKEIQVWGRGIFDVSRYEESAVQWLPSWFSSQTALDKLFLLGGAVSLAVLAVSAGIILIKRKREWYDWLLAAITADFSFLFWLFSAPLIRYGCVYMWLAPIITLAGPALGIIKSKKIWNVVYLTLLVAGCYKLFAFGKETAAACDGQFLVMQKDYENFEAEEYEINGVTFYYPKEGDRTGYEAFPSSPVKAAIALRGDKIEDGFRYNK